MKPEPPDSPLPSGSEAPLPSDSSVSGSGSGVVGTIAILTGEIARYSRFWLALTATAKPGPIKMIVKIGLNIAEARNQALREAKGDWIWFLDDDQYWPPDTLVKLLERNVDIVQPLILMRQYPFSPVHMGPPTEDGSKYWRYALVPGESGLKECHAVGTGGMLIRRAVWETIPEPWFEIGQLNPEVLSEDIIFCKKAKDRGFKIYCDLDHPMGHLTPVELWPKRRPDGKWMTDLRIHTWATSVPQPRANFSVDYDPEGRQIVKARIPDASTDSDG